MAEPDDHPLGPTHVRGVPNPDRLRMIPGHVAIYGVADNTGAAEAVAQRLGRPVSFVDDAGYHDEIVAGTEDPEQDRFAWLACRSKDTGGYVDIQFRLCAMVRGTMVVEWEPKTYNPYFGINTLVLSWSGEDLVFLYSEKHHVYLARFDAAGQLDLKRRVDNEFLSESDAARADERRRARLVAPPARKRAWLPVAIGIVIGIVVWWAGHRLGWI